MPPRPPTHELVRALLVKGVALVYLVAASSLALQLGGLVGPDGLLPLSDLLTQERILASRAPITGTLAVDQALRVPTLAWWLPWHNAGTWLGGLTVGAALLALMGVAEGPALGVAWVGWASMVAVGQVFTRFQWDALLLEVGFAVLLLARWPGAAGGTPVAGLWLLRWILARLIVFAGVVKLTSGDPSWWDGTAMGAHYLTQPLPGPLAPLWHRLPGWWHAIETWGAVLLELAVPWAFLAGRRWRVIAGGLIVLLMANLAITGSYGYFQLLTVVLCASLLDDDHVRWLFPRARVPKRPPPGPVHRGLVGGVAGSLVAVSLIGMAPRYAGVALPGPLATANEVAQRARVVSHYGLFAVMTQRRPIPVLEARWGDGPWTELTWRWQPTDVSAPLPYPGLHMPRLDWQLWFAGLSSCERHPWARNLLRRVVAGSEPVEALIGDLRLSGQPPDEVRYTVYDYAFAPPGSPEAAAGQVWTREPVGLYCSIVRRADLPAQPPR